MPSVSTRGQWWPAHSHTHGSSCNRRCIHRAELRHTHTHTLWDHELGSSAAPPAPRALPGPQQPEAPGRSLRGLRGGSAAEAEEHRWPAGTESVHHPLLALRQGLRHQESPTAGECPWRHHQAAQVRVREGITKQDMLQWCSSDFLLFFLSLLIFRYKESCINSLKLTSLLPM